MGNEIMHYNQIDPAIEERVEELLERMTLEEKIGQMVQVTAYPQSENIAELLKKDSEGEGSLLDKKAKPSPEREGRIRAGTVGSIFAISEVQVVNHYQRIAVQESRLGIPLIVGNDIIHGFRTIFPIPLAESCTWNPVLIEQAARIAAEEASANGTDWIFAPMVDVARDPRWGRVAEGAGEDTFLGMTMAQARVRGFQTPNLVSGRRIVACPKHFVAYGAIEGGREYNNVDVSERTLREVYLPPFHSAFEAGAGTVMSSFNDIGGVPATANHFTLSTVLREEWKWPGMVVSDYQSILELIAHGIATDLKDAARLSILAGLDMDMMSDAYANHLSTLVQEGKVPEKLVNEAARRVLRLKFKLGLFEKPYTDEMLAHQIILSNDFRELALKVAQQSIVVLKNEKNLLPLSPGKQRIAVIGPLADARQDMLGTWVIFGQSQDADTVLEGIHSFQKNEDLIIHVKGCSTKGNEPLQLEEILAAAQAADVVVLVLGESSDMSGEAKSRSHLGLPGHQQELLDALSQTSKPLIGVLLTGRPLVIPHLTQQLSALLVAWHGGIRGGQAISDILFGVVNPSGKLTSSWPRTEGQIPIYYAHKSTGRPLEGSGTTQFSEPYKTGYQDEPNKPLFPFGYGLSYTTFHYSQLNVETTQVFYPDDTVVISAEIENTGTRTGTEIVQLYIQDLVGSVTRPVKELKGFQRLTLEPGEKQLIRFKVPVRELSYIGLDLNFKVEPGAFKVWIGPDSLTGLEGGFEVI